jgi:hypothetical protein
MDCIVLSIAVSLQPFINQVCSSFDELLSIASCPFTACWRAEYHARGSLQSRILCRPHPVSLLRHRGADRLSLVTPVGSHRSKTRSSDWTCGIVHIHDPLRLVSHVLDVSCKSCSCRLAEWQHRSYQSESLLLLSLYYRPKLNFRVWWANSPTRRIWRRPLVLCRLSGQRVSQLRQYMFDMCSISLNRCPALSSAERFHARMSGSPEPSAARFGTSTRTSYHVSPLPAFVGCHFSSLYAS